MRQSMTGIFKDLASNRRDKANAQIAFVVARITKKGVPEKTSNIDLRWNGTRTLEAAEARRAEMARLNPGSTYVVLPYQA